MFSCEKEQKNAMHIEVALGVKGRDSLIEGSVEACLKVYGRGSQPGVIWVVTLEYHRHLVGRDTLRCPGQPFLPKKRMIQSCVSLVPTWRNHGVQK